MRKIVWVMLTLFLGGVLAPSFNIQTARASVTTIYIRADGSIDPPDAPVLTTDGVTYTMTANIINRHIVLHYPSERNMDRTPPVTTPDYDGAWRSSDFTITLTATDDKSGVAETYYRINDEPVMRVSVNGHPRITTEGSNNKLEYWSVDNVGNEEQCNTLTGIKLDKSRPYIKFYL